jgi:hypothetical protein
VQLAILAFDLEHIGFRKNTFHLGGHVVDGDVGDRSALGGVGEKLGSLVRHLYERGRVAGPIERVVSAAVDGGMRHFGHAGHGLDQYDRVARRGLAGGLVSYCACQLHGLRERACKKKAGNDRMQNSLHRSHVFFRSPYL